MLKALNVAKKTISIENTPISIFCNLKKAFKAVMFLITSQENWF